MDPQDLFHHIPATVRGWGNSSRSWTFSGEDCLYRDAERLRVVGDFEGASHYCVTGPALVTADFEAAPLEGDFQEFVCVRALGTEPITVECQPMGPSFQVGEVIRQFTARDVLGDAPPPGWTVQNATGELPGPSVSHLNAASWRVSPTSEAILVARVYDAFHGRQRARVLVDRNPVALWYDPEQDRQNRWRLSWIVIPMPTAAEIMLTIDPPAGTPLWNFAAIRVHALHAVE